VLLVFSVETERIKYVVPATMGVVPGITVPDPLKTTRWSMRSVIEGDDDIMIDRPSKSTDRALIVMAVELNAPSVAAVNRIFPFEKSMYRLPIPVPLTDVDKSGPG
jgi:hypothetical protein